MNTTHTKPTSIYDQPSTIARLAFLRQQLIQKGIIYPKVRISGAYIPTKNYVADDQQWVQRVLLG